MPPRLQLEMEETGQSYIRKLREEETQLDPYDVISG